jgi:hypothetical protein
MPPQAEIVIVRFGGAMAATIIPDYISSIWV